MNFKNYFWFVIEGVVFSAFVYLASFVLACAVLAASCANYDLVLAIEAIEPRGNPPFGVSHMVWMKMTHNLHLSIFFLVGVPFIIFCMVERHRALKSSLQPE
jgi:hypothetical protein